MKAKDNPFSTDRVHRIRYRLQDTTWDALLDPPLTTVATPARQLGFVAAERLVSVLDAGEGPVTGEIRLLPHLIVRHSTGPAPS